MGIAKISNRCLQNNCVKQGLFLTEVEQQECEMLYHPIVDSDDYDFIESSCECVALEDQLVSIPYELYSLPDLKEILSLDAWNTCLNEEDRIKLSAFLPDLDQQTFWLTLKELLSGQNVFFGSPLFHFSRRLKGGFYSLSVLQNREVLLALEKRKYYHYLRSYHEKMIQVFKDMQRIWSTCLPDINVEERLQIWKKRKIQSKPVLSVDLNAPPDDEIYGKLEKVSDAIPSIKRTKCSEKDMIYLGLPITNPRGVLKLKPIMERTRIGNSRSLPCTFPVTFGPRPKGVLKVKSNSCTMGPQGISGSTYLNSSSMPPASGSLLHLHKFPLAIPYDSKRGTKSFYGGSEFAISEARDDKGCRFNAKYLESQRGKPPFPSIDSKMELQDFREKCSMNIKVYSRKTNGCRLEDSENNRHNSGLAKRSSIPSINSRVSGIDNTELEAYNLNSTGKNLTDGCMAVSTALACLATPAEVAFPITYRRKKPYLKQNSSLTHAVHIAEFESRTLQKEDYGSLQNSQNF